MNDPVRSTSMLATLRRIGALAAPYFRSEDRWKARGLLLVIIVLNLGTVYMAVLNNQWFGRFYNALENRDQAVFWRELGFFCWIAFGAITIGILKF